ncbi:unnamed protein product, partial [Staurois parvus]
MPPISAPSSAAHQCCLSVPSSSAAYYCRPSVLPISAHKCCPSVPISAASSGPPHQCPPVPPHQCSLSVLPIHATSSVPISAAYPCHLISAHLCCLS